MIDWEGLKAAYEKTTKGKWRDDNGYRVYGPITPMDFNNEYEPLLFETKHTDATGGDSTFCALVHNTFPTILAQHEADQRVIEAANEELTNTRHRLAALYGMLIKKQRTAEIDEVLAEFDKVKP